MPRVAARRCAAWSIRAGRSAGSSAKRLGALLRGLPHALLLFDEAGDVSVLLSALCKPCRFTMSGDPLHTQLLIARHAPGWASTFTSTRHYLYRVHRSRSYLTPPSLAAALYLLILRWLGRDYEATCALAPSCVTDEPLTEEEGLLWSQLSDFVDDCQPAAHATRLKIHLGARACPGLASPWDAALSSCCTYPSWTTCRKRAGSRRRRSSYY